MEEEISTQQSANIQDLFAGAATIGGAEEGDESPAFQLEPEAVKAILGTEASEIKPISADPPAAESSDAITVPEKTDVPVDFKSLASQYSKEAGLDYDTEKDLLSKINNQQEYEEIVGKMIARDSYIDSQVEQAVSNNPLFIPVLQDTANPLEVLQSAVKTSLGDFYSDNEFDSIMETLYVDGLPTEKGKNVLGGIKQSYAKMYQEVVAGASKYADDTYNETKAYKLSLAEAAKTVKLLGAIVPNQELQAELIEEVQKGSYLTKINAALKDNSTKAETELLLAAIANPRLKAMMAKQIFELGVNSKKNEILKSKL